MKLKKRIKASKWFLTAKGKYVDTFELHAYGSGLVSALLLYSPMFTLQAIGLFLCLALSLVAVGLEAVKPKPYESHPSLKNVAVPFRDQIRKEGQYTILGIATPFIVEAIFSYIVPFILQLL